MRIPVALSRCLRARRRVFVRACAFHIADAGGAEGEVRGGVWGVCGEGSEAVAAGLEMLSVLRICVKRAQCKALACGGGLES